MPRPKKLVQPTTAGDDLSDLGALAMRQTATITLIDPRFPGKSRDSGYRVEIESVFSKAARDVINGVHTPLKIVDTDVEVKDTSFSDTLSEQIIAVTRRWWKVGSSTDTITLRGEAMKASPENVRKVYEDPEFAWFAGQVRAAYLHLAGFFETPKTA